MDALSNYTWLEVKSIPEPPPRVPLVTEHLDTVKLGYIYLDKWHLNVLFLTVSEELKDLFKMSFQEDQYKAFKIIIKDRAWCPVSFREVNDGWSVWLHDWNLCRSHCAAGELNSACFKKMSEAGDFESLALPLLEDDAPCYVLYRLDDTREYSWVMVMWCPPGVNVRTPSWWEAWFNLPLLWLSAGCVTKWKHQICNSVWKKQGQSHERTLMQCSHLSGCCYWWTGKTEKKAKVSDFWWME